jgi:hypothetical protein
MTDDDEDLAYPEMLTRAERAYLLALIEVDEGENAGSVDVDNLAQRLKYPLLKGY